MVKHDIDGLRAKMLELSLLSCGTVKEQLSVISKKLAEIHLPNEDCKCDQDCRVTEKYCCDHFFGFCIGRCSRSHVDQGCVAKVNQCYSSCSDAFGKVTAQTSELMDKLNHQFNQISSENQDLLKACDKFYLSDKTTHQDL